MSPADPPPYLPRGGGPGRGWPRSRGPLGPPRPPRDASRAADGVVVRCLSPQGMRCWHCTPLGAYIAPRRAVAASGRRRVRQGIIQWPPRFRGATRSVPLSLAGGALVDSAARFSCARLGCLVAVAAPSGCAADTGVSSAGTPFRPALPADLATSDPHPVTRLFFSPRAHGCAVFAFLLPRPRARFGPRAAFPRPSAHVTAVLSLLTPTNTNIKY